VPDPLTLAVAALANAVVKYQVHVSLAILAALTYYDLRYREVDWKLLAASAPPAALASVTVYLFGGAPPPYLYISLGTTAALVATAYALRRLGVMGGADAVVFLLVGVANPGMVIVGPLYLTPLMVSLLLGSVLALGMVLYNLVYNAAHRREFEEAVRGAGRSKALYMLLGRVMSAQEFRSRRFYFPLAHAGARRILARVAEEPLEGSGHSVEGEYVVAAYGVPTLALLLAGYIVYVFLLASSMITPCGAPLG